MLFFKSHNYNIVSVVFSQILDALKNAENYDTDNTDTNMNLL